MKVDIVQLSTTELLQLAAAAVAELQARSSAGTVALERWEAAEPKVIVVNEPSRSDQSLALKIVSLLKRNGFVLADERDQYRAIVGKFPEWAKSQKIPPDVGGSVARRWLRLHGSS